MKRIGMLTSGGDCQGLNAALRGVAKALYHQFGDDVEIIGIQDGYRGLIYGDYQLMKPDDFSGILTRGGTILGTSRQPFKLMRVIDENSVDKVASMKAHYKDLHLDCLVVLGGNGTHKTANLLSSEGLNVVSLPKTIDNDVWGTDITFGFQSAVDVATNVIDCIHTTASSHGRIFIVEIMGHKAGWLNLYAGIAGGADCILLPEIPYQIENVAAFLEQRANAGKNFSILAVAEGAMSKKESKLSKKEFAEARAKCGHPTVGYLLADQLGKLLGQSIYVTIPGHVQRGGSPCPADRVLSTRFGVAAAELIREGNFGNMVALKGDSIVPVALSKVAGKLKTVPPDCQVVQSARDMGICLGD